MDEKRKEDNIFVVGPEARGPSFIGREKEIEELGEAFNGVTSISLVGPTRIGKSSLVREALRRNSDAPQCLQIYLSAAHYEDAFHFWKDFWVCLEKQLKEKKIWNDVFEEEFNQLREISYNDNSWYSEMTLPIRFILQEIDSLGYRLVLVVDEFDSITMCFGDNVHYYQYLRSICSEADWATNGILISRRPLPLVVANYPSLSNFENVFMNMPLHAFSDEDIKIYYNILSEHGIQLTESGMTRLKYYTGSLPYLCSMFGHCMLNDHISQLDEKEIDLIHQKCLPQIEDFYKSLEDRLREDKHFDFIWSLSMKLPQLDTEENKRRLDTMQAMGVLTKEDVNESESASYYAYNYDFMEWISSRPSDKTTWECIDSAETKLKEIMVNEIPLLGMKFKDIKDDKMKQNDVDEQFLQLGCAGEINCGGLAYHYKGQGVYMPDASLIDLVTLTQKILCIKDLWDSHFFRYFSFDSGSDWKQKLDFIKGIRNPIDHNTISFISEKDQNLCKKYCEDLLKIDISE